MKEFSYRDVTESREKGIVVLRGLMLEIDQRIFSLTVATPQYIEALKKNNKQLDEELRRDENILPIESVEDLIIVVEKLSQMSQEDIEPYLVDQIKTTPA